ncbi:MAG: DNA-directed RNA polymerase subunit omega [Verrucomicrobia bacterium]|nr:DNA-directed RNA polymerase subunit omega [Verrucomicrobiota bacterium]
MKSQYLEVALQQVPNRHILINIVSKRVRQLIEGFRPLTTTEGNLSHMDIALKEISEGKIAFKLPDQKELAEERARKRKKRSL